MLIERLSHSPELLPLAMDEALRLFPPVPQLERVVSKTAWLVGQQFQEGSRLIVHVDAANRDPRQFADRDRSELFRQAVSLGGHRSMGPGASLVQVEATLAITSVLIQCSDLALDPAVPLERLPSAEICGLRRLAVTYQPKPMVTSR